MDIDPNIKKLVHVRMSEQTKRSLKDAQKFTYPSLYGKDPSKKKMRIGYYTTDVFVNDLFNLMLPVYRFHDKE